MIRSIDIKLNAAHPELPLVEATTYTNSPSAVFVRGVPRKVGTWEITSVYVSVTFPDGSATTHTAALAANGIWVATFGGTATAGRTTNGLRVLADGTDENGDAVTGYVLGVADFAVLSLASSPTPETTTYAVRFLPDGAPETPQTGDLWLGSDGLWYVYDGSAAVALSAVTSVNGAAGAVVLTGADIAVSEEDATKVDAAITTAMNNAIHAGSIADNAFSMANDVLSAVSRAETPTYNSSRLAKSGGVWSAIWGALTALPTGFASLYDWVVDALAAKADASALADYLPKSGGVMTGSLTTKTPLTVYDSGGVGSVQLNADTHAIDDVDSVGNEKSFALPAASGTLALTSNIPYSQTAVTLAAGTTSLALTDREANAYDMTALDAGDSVAVSLPTPTSGKAANVLLTVLTGAAVPSLTFSGTFICADSSWYNLTANAYNVFSFTSTGFSGVWTVGRLTQATA